MAGYKSILRRTVLALPKNTVAKRMKVYQRARQSLIKQLTSGELQLSEAQASTIYEELEEAIQEVEAESVKFWAGNSDVSSGIQSDGENEDQHDGTSHAGIAQDLSDTSEISQEIGRYKHAHSVAKRSMQGKVPLRKSMAVISIAMILGFAGISYMQWDRIENRFGIGQKLSEILGSEVISDSDEKKTSQDVQQIADLPKEEIKSGETVENYSPSTAGDSTGSNGKSFALSPEAEAASILLTDSSNGEVKLIKGGVSWIPVQENTQSGNRKTTKVALARFVSEEVRMEAYLRPKYDSDFSTTYQIDVHFNQLNPKTGAEIAGMPRVDLKSSSESKTDSLPSATERISSNHIRATLSPGSHACNLSLLQESNIIEFPIEFMDRSHALIRLDKGETGSKLIDSLYGDWQANGNESFNQCSVFREKNGESVENGSKFLGNVIWHTGLDGTSTGGNLPRLVADVSIEEIGLSAHISMNPVKDSQLDANHIVEIKFEFADGFQELEIADVAELNMKHDRNSAGDSLKVKTSTRVLDNSFWIVLSPLPNSEKENFTLLNERNWIELLINLREGGQAAILLEKGKLGREVVESTLLSWQEHGLIPKL